MTKNLFYKTGVDITNTRSMFEFLKDHSVYNTMSSWNQLKSIGHNVKLYNLCLDGDWQLALAHLYDTSWFWVNVMIRDWEADHPGYRVGFNGRSGGYLVLYNEKNCKNVLPDYITDCANYEDFKEWVKNYYSDKIKEVNPSLKQYVKLVRDFDRLCDELRVYVNELSMMPVEETGLTYL